MGILRSRLAVGVAALVIGAGAASAVTFAVADGPTTPNTYYACRTSVGKVRPSSIQVNNAPTCWTGETNVSWNAEGPTGPQGPAGPPGEPAATSGTLIEFAEKNVPYAYQSPVVFAPVDTSECAAISAFWQTATTDNIGWAEFLMWVPGATSPLGALPAKILSTSTTGGILYPITELTGGLTEWTPGPQTSLRLGQHSDQQPGVITRAGIYCEPRV